MNIAVVIRGLLAGAVAVLVAGLAGAAPADRAASPDQLAAEDLEIGDGPELDEESLEDLVADAQRLLNLRGFDPGPIDGQLGLRTQRAIRDYQDSARSRGTLEALKGPPTEGGDAALVGMDRAASTLTR
jgi:peptidoglycan hydrolase-like protein with peptidoglycan-binding domain